MDPFYPSGHISIWKNQYEPFQDFEIRDMFLFSFSFLSLSSFTLGEDYSSDLFRSALSEEDGKKSSRLTQSHGARKLHTETISSLCFVIGIRSCLRHSFLLEAYEDIFDLPSQRMNSLLVIILFSLCLQFYSALFFSPSWRPFKNKHPLITLKLSLFPMLCLLWK